MGNRTLLQGDLEWSFEYNCFHSLCHIVTVCCLLNALHDEFEYKKVNDIGFKNSAPRIVDCPVGRFTSDLDYTKAQKGYMGEGSAGDLYRCV